MGCQKVKSWWMRLVGYFHDHLGACWLTLGSCGWLDFQYCPMLWAWAVRFEENHGQILKLNLVHPALLLVPHSTVPHQLEQCGTSLPPESCQGFSPRYPFASHLWDATLPLGCGSRLKLVMACFSFQITARVFRRRHGLRLPACGRPAKDMFHLPVAITPKNLR